ncbi:hypothetical protein MRX96_007789 [Rhipicephalus microplus]
MPRRLAVIHNSHSARPVICRCVVKRCAWAGPRCGGATPQRAGVRSRRSSNMKGSAAVCCDVVTGFGRRVAGARTIGTPCSHACLGCRHLYTHARSRGFPRQEMARLSHRGTISLSLLPKSFPFPRGFVQTISGVYTRTKPI